MYESVEVREVVRLDDTVALTKFETERVVDLEADKDPVRDNEKDVEISELKEIVCVNTLE